MVPFVRLNASKLVHGKVNANVCTISTKTCPQRTGGKLRTRIHSTINVDGTIRRTLSDVCHRRGDAPAPCVVAGCTCQEKRMVATVAFKSSPGSRSHTPQAAVWL